VTVSKHKPSALVRALSIPFSSVKSSVAKVKSSELGDADESGLRFPLQLISDSREMAEIKCE
jgi:hypothetical protein